MQEGAVTYFYAYWSIGIIVVALTMIKRPAIYEKNEPRYLAIAGVVVSFIWPVVFVLWKRT